MKRRAGWLRMNRGHQGFSLADARGLTLVELMLAVALLGILLLFVLQVFNFGSRQKRESDEIARQAGVAQYVAARLAAGLEEPRSGTYTQTIPWPPGGGERQYTYQLSFTPAADPADGTLCRITVAPANAAFVASQGDNYLMMVLVP